MAFNFTVETGEIIPGANSYVTVEDADDYLAANIHVGPVWAGLDLEIRQKLLVWASRYLDQRAVWNGRIVSLAQPMRWPRTGVKNADGVGIPHDSIPIQLQQAVIEMARYLIDVDRSVEGAQDGVKKMKIDVIEFEFREGYTPPEVPNEIVYLLAGLGSLNSGSRQFAKVRRA